METPDSTSAARGFRRRILLQALVVLDYACGVILLLISVRERRNFAAEWALCAGIMAAVAGALLATIFRRRSRLRSAWLCALCGLAAGIAASVLISR